MLESPDSVSPILSIMEQLRFLKFMSSCCEHQPQMRLQQSCEYSCCRSLRNSGARQSSVKKKQKKHNTLAFRRKKLAETIKQNKCGIFWQPRNNINEFFAWIYFPKSMEKNHRYLPNGYLGYHPSLRIAARHSRRCVTEDLAELCCRTVQAWQVALRNSLKTCLGNMGNPL